MRFFPWSNFSPLSLSPALWLDASDSSTLYDATSGGSLVAADGAIARWEDKSGNARHATQATSGKQPLRKTSIQNGNDIARFDGSNDVLATISTIPSTTMVTAFIVFINNNSATSPIIYELGTNFNSLSGFIFYSAPPNKAGSGHFINNYSVFEETIGSTGLFRVWTSTHDTTQTSNEVVLRRDGSLATGSYVINNNNISGFIDRALFIGGRGTTPTLPLNGDIVEIIIYPTILSDTNRSNVEGYLKSKWGTP